MSWDLDIVRGTLMNRATELSALNPEERRRRAVEACAAKDAEVLWALCEATLALEGTAGILSSPHTVRSYRTGVTQFLAYATQHAWNLTRPDRNDAQLYVNHLISRGRKIATVRSRVAAAAHLYRALRWAGACDSLPFEDVVVPKDNEHSLDKRPPYSEQVLRRVTTRIQSCMLDVTTSARDRRNATQAYFLLILLNHSGLRIDEVLHLRWPDVHLDDDPHLVVRSGKGRKSRLVPLSSSLASAFEAYQRLPRARRHSEDFVLPFRHRTSAEYHLAQYFAVDATGSATSDWRGFHAFRKAMGSRLYEELEDFAAVAEVLGHVNINTTKAYVRVGTARARKVLQRW